LIADDADHAEKSRGHCNNNIFWLSAAVSASSASFAIQVGGTDLKQQTRYRD